MAVPEFKINKAASKLDHIFLNDDWTLTELYDRIYSISLGEKEQNWLVKTYPNRKYAIRESNNLIKLRGVKNVPRLLAVNLNAGLNFIILSKEPGIDLIEYIDSKGKLSEQTGREIAKQLLRIIADIHKKGVIHGDIKPENVLYHRRSGRITLIDFEGKQTDDYRSPEQIRREPLTTKTDIWSAGILFYTILRGSIPFSSSREILNKKLTFPKKWSDELKDFLGCLIERDVLIRYDAVAALNHSWLQDKSSASP